MFEFKSPKWWKEFKILGRKHQAASDKPQATETQAASGKHQARRHKPRAASRKQQAPR